MMSGKIANNQSTLTRHTPRIAAIAGPNPVKFWKSLKTKLALGQEHLSLNAILREIAPTAVYGRS